MANVRGGSVLIVAAIIALSAGSPAQTAGDRERVLIRTAKPYGAVVARVGALGGTVSYQYTYIDAIAAEVPTAGLTALGNLVGTAAISKDVEVALPGTVDTVRGRQIPGFVQQPEVQADAAEVLGEPEITALAQSNPSAYLLNLGIANVTPLLAGGITGAGVVVGVIDAGIRPGFPHISLDGSVIGCEDFVGDALGCSNSGNNFHGTFVAGMISANVAFAFAPASALRVAVLAECPACFANPPVNTAIPMLGTAPLSSLYALRVFGPTGGAPSSRVLAAMDRAIALREAYNADHTKGANISIVNMSLGGSTVFAGHDLEDQMVDAMLDHDIVPVIAAGNAGQASLTVGSPGTAPGALTVGAASLSHNERIVNRLQLGPVNGPLFRPSLGHQTAFFSSRGPNADGRLDPDVVMNGMDCYGQGSGNVNSISFGSGTSFATPSVSGVAALLRQKYPGATARQIRNAIIASANPAVLSDGSTVLDQGAGYVDAAAASALLATGLVSEEIPESHSTKNVNVNIQQNTFLHVQDGYVTESASSLKPAERHEIVYNVHPNTQQVIISLANVTPQLPPAAQNHLFGDDILLTVHSAKTSAIGEGDYRVFEFTKGGTFVVNNPEAGLMRITLAGDWTNAGTISADVSVLSTTEAIPQLSTQGKIADRQLLSFPLTIPSGVSNAEFRLSWREDWGSYPTADLDMFLIDPVGGANVGGATLSDPETVTIKNPKAGNWTILVNGFNIPTGTDKFELRVSLDGKVQKLQ